MMIRESVVLGLEKHRSNLLHVQIEVNQAISEVEIAIKAIRRARESGLKTETIPTLTLVPKTKSKKATSRIRGKNYNIADQAIQILKSGIQGPVHLDKLAGMVNGSFGKRIVDTNQLSRTLSAYKSYNGNQSLIDSDGQGNWYLKENKKAVISA